VTKRLLGNLACAVSCRPTYLLFTFSASDVATGASNQKERPLRTPVANSWRRHCVAAHLPVYFSAYVVSWESHCSVTEAVVY